MEKRNFKLFGESCIAIGDETELSISVLSEPFISLAKSMEKSTIYQERYDFDRISLFMNNTDKESEISSVSNEFINSVNFSDTVKELRFVSRNTICELYINPTDIEVNNSIESVVFKNAPVSSNFIIGLVNTCLELNKISFDMKDTSIDLLDCIDTLFVVSDITDFSFRGSVDYSHVLNKLCENKDKVKRLEISVYNKNDLDALGKLTNLEYLKLSSYEIESLPDCLSKFTKLKTLDISETQISMDTYKLAILIHEKYGIDDVILPKMDIK